MGIFDWMTGSRSAPEGVPRETAAALRTRLMALNRDTSPIQIRDGKREGVDLVAEWKIVDAKWYEIFAKAGIQRVFKVLMKIDEAQGVVRSADQEWLVEWRAGVPDLSLAASGFKGQKWEKSFESVYAFREDGSWGEIYSYKFDTGEIKGPLKKAVGEAGWGWKGVAFGKL
jgi:L-rhamnose mutarotase